MISIFAACVAFVCILCFLVSLLLIGYTKKTNKHNYLLALFFILLSYPIFILFLINTGYLVYVPHVYRTGAIAFLLYMPASFLYIRSILTDKKLSKFDLIHLLPALIYIIDYFPFFFIPASEKIAFMHSKKLSQMVLYFYESRFFIPGFYIMLKYALALLYWLFQVYFIIKIFRIKNPEFKNENTAWLRWLTIFVSSQIFLFLPMFNVLKPGYGDDELTVFLFIGGFTGLTSVFLFLFPQILYGIKGVIIISKTEDISTDKIGNEKIGSEKTVHKYLSKNKTDSILLQINSHFTENKAFLDKQYTMTKMAHELKISPQYISAVINEREEMNFNDYINKFRVLHCIELFKKMDTKKLLLNLSQMTVVLIIGTLLLLHSKK